MLILTNNRVTDAVAGQDQHFLKMSEGPFSHDAGHMTLTYYLIGKGSDVSAADDFWKL